MTAAEQPAAGQDTFGEWVILEMMGHRRLAGWLTEQEIAGKGFLRLQMDDATQFYSPAAVYCITPTTEELARRVAATSRPQPVTRYELAAAEAGGPF